MIMPLFDKVTRKPGSSPGEIAHVGEKKTEKVRIRMICYDQANLSEKEFETIESCLECYRQSNGVKWINIDGLHDTETLKKIGEAFDIHLLALEDIVNTTQRPKVEAYDKHLFVVLKMFYVKEEVSEIEAEQMSFILGQDHVLSFQEKVGDVFGEVRNRLRTGGTGFIRKAGADYLLYALMDAIVDHYFIVMEKIGLQLEDADDELTGNSNPKTLRKIHALKKQVVFLKRMTWPLRELFGSILRLETKLITKKTHVFFRDVQDHSIQVLDALEGFREMISGMIDLYQSSVGNRMNEVMKVLTIIATLFIPPTFVAGIYGMNFENMPELHTRFGYFVAVGVMLTSITSMLVYFRKKKWL